MNTSRRALVAAIALAASSTVSADCVIHVTRTACPGKEAESYAKCGGKQSCDETRPAADAAQCTVRAKEACANSRIDVTRYKKITASFNGKELDDGEDYCEGHPDYPYAGMETCSGL